MRKAVDLEGLSEEQAQLIMDFVEFLRIKTKDMKDTDKALREEEITFAAWPLGVKGRLTVEKYQKDICEGGLNKKDYYSL